MATHTNIGDLLGDLHNWIQAHPGCQVLCSDNIDDREIGFVGFQTRGIYAQPHIFSIPLDVLHEQCSEELWSYMGSAAGRQTLARILENPIISGSANPCGEQVLSTGECLLRVEEQERPVYPTAWEHLLADDPV